MPRKVRFFDDAPFFLAEVWAKGYNLCLPIFIYNNKGGDNMRNDIIEAKESILQWIQEGRTKAYISEQLNCKQETLNRYLKKMGIKYQGKQGQHEKPNLKRKTALEYIEFGKSTKSNILKYKILQDGLKEYKCEYCGQTEWNNLPIPLELHHIDGNHYNNELSNLMLVCPNCHAQLTSAQNKNMANYSYGRYLSEYFGISDNELNISSTNYKRKRTNKCVDCGKPILATSIRCVECSLKYRSSCSYNREELKELIRTTNFSELGRINNVSDNTVRKWCKNFDLPTKSREIKKYTDEQWADI